MSAPALTCDRCRETLMYYRPDFAKVLDVAVEVKDIDEVIARHAIKPYNVWEMQPQRKPNQSKLVRAAYQCNVHPDHRWKKNIMVGDGLSVAPLSPAFDFRGGKSP